MMPCMICGAAGEIFFERDQPDGSMFLGIACSGGHLLQAFMRAESIGNIMAGLMEEEE